MEQVNPGDIGGGMAIGYATLCVCFWANAMGWLKDGFGLSIGIVLVGFFVVYMIGGLYFLKQGNTLAGCVYVVFSVCFGLFNGLCNVGSAVCANMGIPFDTSIAGISSVLAGIFMFFMLPGMRYASKADFLVYFFAGFGVTASGLAGLGIMAAPLGMFSGWALLGSGISVYWSAVSGVLKTTGIDIPCGAPFFKEPGKK